MLDFDDLEEEEKAREADVPRKLLPASAIAAAMPDMSARLGPMKTYPNSLKNKKAFEEKATSRLRGDLYGLPFPANPEEFNTPEYGAGWLTQAFHLAGTLPRDNRVTRITSFRRFVGGGSGPKALFTVEYEKHDECLDTTLFMKQVWTIEENKQQRIDESCLGRFGDCWGGEINFYRFVSPYVPFPVPKLYFADMNRESTEACCINACVDWPEAGKTDFAAYEILPPCEKCEDYNLKDSHDYYFAIMRRLGTIAGLEKTGQLGPHLSSIIWSESLGWNAAPPDMAENTREFIENVAPQIWPAHVKTKGFLDKFVRQMAMVQSVLPRIGPYVNSDPLYVGFGHQNGNSDNAYFYRNAEGTMEAGILDWGSTGFMAYATEFMGSFIGCTAEMLAEYDDRLVRAFVDAYHDTAAPALNVDELILHFRLLNAASTYNNLIAGLSWTSEKHPQGRPFWKTVTAWNDETIRSNFFIKFGVSMFYNKVVLWSLRGDTYSESIEEWARRHPA